MNEALILIVNGMAYPISTVTSSVIGKMLHMGRDDVYVDLDNMNISADVKVKILKKIVELEINRICIVYDDDYLNSQKNGRRMYNSLFSKINSIIGIYNYKLSTAVNDANDYLINHFPQLLADMNCYINAQKILQSIAIEKGKKY